MAPTSRSAERPTGSGPCLVVIYGDDIGRIFNLDVGTTVIGRSTRAEIRVDQESISRKHAKVVNNGKSITVIDLGTTNGTYVNDQPIEQFVLRDGDLIKVGRTIFKLLVGGNIERLYHETMYRAATFAQLSGTARPDRERPTAVTIAGGVKVDPGDGEAQ